MMMKVKGVARVSRNGGMIIYIYYREKLLLITLLFILNYIFSPKVYIYYLNVLNDTSIISYYFEFENWDVTILPPLNNFVLEIKRNDH